MSCRAFTVVEALVAVALLGILLVLGLVGLQKVRDQGQEVRCMTHLRQWGSAIHRYVADHNQSFPLSYPFGDGRSWQTFYAPSLVADYVLNGVSPEEWMEGKGINGCRRFHDLYHSYLYNMHLGTPGFGHRYLGRMNLIAQPSALLMMTDASDTGPSQSGFSYLPGHPERIGKVHRGRYHALYVDGHLEARSEVDLRQILP